MKNIKRISAVILSAIILIFTFGVGASAGNYSDGYVTYTQAYLKDSSGSFGNYYKVSSCLSIASGKITVKSEIGGVPVVAVGQQAFANTPGITEAVIPSSVAKIEKYAFENCAGLKTVTVENPKCSLEEGIFYGCSLLEKCDLPSETGYIPTGVFKNCVSLKNAAVPSSTTMIGTEAFFNCLSLTEINIPKNVYSIGQNAFSNCASVEKITVESGNEYYKTVENCLYEADGETLVQFPNGCGKTEFAVPGGTKTIGNFAFGGNSDLTKISLPESLETVEPYAFYNCAALSDVIIPSGVKTLGSQSFGECQSLKSIIIPKSVTQYEGAFYKSGLEEAVIESGSVAISVKAFEKCTKLESVNIPSSVKSIGLGAFDGCSSLKSLSIPESVERIGKNAFINCPQLKLTTVIGSAAYKYAKENGIQFEAVGERAVTSVEIASKPDKTNYYYKTELNTTGLSLKVNYNDDTSEIVTSGFTVSPNYFDTAGTKEITVLYQGETCNFNVNVSYAWWQILIRILLLGFLWY